MTDGLSIRLRLHRDYSTNPYGWQNWVFDQYKIPENARILELGCGTGEIWQGRKLPAGRSLTLTDVSPDMTALAAKNLANFGSPIDFATLDARQLPYENATFDVVIANHLLPFFDQPSEVLHEISRVLKNDGQFYATTFGADNMRQLHQLDGGSTATNFTLENGNEILKKHFSQVERLDYPDDLRVTKTADLLDYISTYKDLTAAEKVDLSEKITDEIAKNGSFEISKRQGIFRCKK